MTLILVPPSPPRDAVTSMRAKAPAVPWDEARKACDVFFARTAGAGPVREDDRGAMIGSVIEIISVGGDRAVPPRSSTNLHLIVEGWAYRAYTLADGGRQITDILLPGDVFGWSAAASRRMENDIRACGRAQVAVLRREVATGRELPSLRRRWECVRDADARRLRSRLVSLGRRDARERLAHVMSEFHDRLRQVGLADADAFACPLTQELLADVLGLTAIHVNRVLQRLRREGLLVFDRPRVFISDLAGLHAAAGFDDGPGPELGG